MPVAECSELISAAIAEDYSAFQTAIRLNDVNASDPKGWTALHIVSRTGNTRMTDLLLAQPTINVNAKNKWKSTPLMIAANAGHLDVLNLLLNHRLVQVDLQADYYGRTALIEAVVKGQLHIVKALVAHGANVNATDKTGRNSALVEAIKNNHVNVATYLLRTGLVDFSMNDLRLQAIIWAGSRGNASLRDELDIAISNFFLSRERR